MAIGLLFGADTNIQYQYQTEIQKRFYQTIKYSPTTQITKTFAPQYSMQYAPNLILGSPNASISGSQQIPQVQVIPYQVPTISQIDQPQEAPMSQSQSQTATAPKPSGIGELILIGAIAIGGLFLLSRLKKKKRKR